jgi:hypothetical protein
MTAGDIIVVKGSPSGRKGNFFDGNDDYVLHDAHAVARVAANDTVGTYSAWIYQNVQATNTNYTFASAGDNDSADQTLRLQVYNGRLKASVKVGGAIQWTTIETATTGSIPLKTWTHVAVVQNGVQPALYVNGVALATTNDVDLDLTAWYDELTNCDKFALGVTETNNTHIDDWNGAIGQVKYWYRALSAAEVLQDFQGEAQTNGDYPDSTYLVFNITMADDGTTDSGTGADNGTLTGQAHYGGVISPFTYAIEPHVSGHAAETINIIANSPTEWTAIIKRGD